jgi:putative Holliday junction resolvase
MARILAVDFGEKRVGLAISDPMGIIAQPLTTIHRQDDEQLIAELKDIVNTFSVGRIVIGIPYRFNGKKSKMADEIEKFSEQMTRDLSIPIVFEDERFTTRMAEATLHMMGKKVGQSRGKIDQIAAAHMLQSYLKRIKG